MNECAEYEARPAIVQKVHVYDEIKVFYRYIVTVECLKDTQATHHHHY